MTDVRSRVLRAMAFFSVLALLVAACSGGSTETTAAGQTPTTGQTVTTSPAGETTPTVSGGADGDFVTVGILAPLTGEIGEFGQIVSETFEMGINEINDTGLNSCGEIQLQVADTETNPEVAIREADQMIGSVKNLVGFFGPSSGEMVALVDTVHEEQLMLVSPYA